MTKTIKKLNLFGIVFLAIFALSTLPAIAKDDADDTPKEITSLNELLLKNILEHSNPGLYNNQSLRINFSGTCFPS